MAKSRASCGVRMYDSISLSEISSSPVTCSGGRSALFLFALTTHGGANSTLFPQFWVNSCVWGLLSSEGDFRLSSPSLPCFSFSAFTEDLTGVWPASSDTSEEEEVSAEEGFTWPAGHFSNRESSWDFKALLSREKRCCRTSPTRLTTLSGVKTSLYQGISFPSLYSIPFISVILVPAVLLFCTLANLQNFSKDILRRCAFGFNDCQAK